MVTSPFNIQIIYLNYLKKLTETLKQEGHLVGVGVEAEVEEVDAVVEEVVWEEALI